MLLRQMRYFVTVVECNSFTEAAEICYISQSAVSQQIQALEKELGVQLMLRQSRRFSLTPAGEFFYNRCRILLKEADDICTETIRIAHADKPVFRVGYLKNYSGWELQGAVAEFSALYPEIPIDIAAGTHEELYDLIRCGKADIVINDQRRAFSDEYENIILKECERFVEISSNDPLSGKERLTFHDLKRIPCILIASPEQYAAEEGYYRDTLGFEGMFIFADNLEEGRLMVLGNRGFLPIEDMGSLPPAAPGGKRIPLYSGDRPLKRNICAFWLKKNTGQYTEEFAAIISRLIKRQGDMK